MWKLIDHMTVELKKKNDKSGMKKKSISIGCFNYKFWLQISKSYSVCNRIRFFL